MFGKKPKKYCFELNFGPDLNTIYFKYDTKEERDEAVKDFKVKIIKGDFYKEEDEEGSKYHTNLRQVQYIYINETGG